MNESNLPIWAQETLERAEAATEGPWKLIDDKENYIGVKVQSKKGDNNGSIN